MKKTPNLWAVLMITLPFAACQKSEISTPGDPALLQQRSKKAGAPTATTSYGGQSTGVIATVWSTQTATVVSTQTILAQTTALPAGGGSQESYATQVSVSNALTAEALQASVAGAAGSTTSVASASKLNFNAGGTSITADSVWTKAGVSCGSAPAGSSGLSNLVVNGTAVAVTGLTNQVVSLPNGGMLIINEQSSNKKSALENITVTGMHILIPNVADIRLASARAEIKCSR
jgi:hypothetical protein